MRWHEVVAVLDALEVAHVSYWVGGGWGVDALVGQQTREHRDLDLAIDGESLAACQRTLERLGYRPETDWLPVRLEYAAAGRGWVDVHPVRLFSDGSGRQEGLDGAFFDYPSSAWSVGQLGGRPVPCISAAQQRVFHSGYELRAQDVHDLALLDGLTG